MMNIDINPSEIMSPADKFFICSNKHNFLECYFQECSALDPKVYFSYTSYTLIDEYSLEDTNYTDEPYIYYAEIADIVNISFITENHRTFYGITLKSW